LRLEPPKLIGRYRLIRRIGRGGSGEVYLARLEAGGGVQRLAAIKVLFHDGDDPRHQAALLAEARLGALICHPNIAQVLDAGVENGVSWFAMEFVPGLSFFELLEAAGGKIPPWIAARIVADACAAVHALHESADERGKALNVVHRDVTPHNVLVSWDGNVKLVDLGVAHSALRASVTKTGVVKGKLGYLSPEQASGAAVDRRCDVFALGVQLWEALAGRRLFKQQTDSETLASIVRCDVPSLRHLTDVPETLGVVATRALMIEPAARFSTASEMQRALDGAFGAAGVVIGCSEVARHLAYVSPNRVREHIRWLGDGPERPSGSASAKSPPTLPSAATAGLARHKPLSGRLMLGAVVGLFALATGLVSLRHAPDRSPRHGRGQAIASELAADPSPNVPAAMVSRTRAQPPTLPEVPQETRRPSTNRSPVRRSARAPDGAGTLYVNASPMWAAIILDGKSVGTTPTVLSNLPVGPHTVDALPLGKGSSIRRQVIVEAGKTVRVGFEFGQQ
jgi:serine/threonine protein kinase